MVRLQPLTFLAACGRVLAALVRGYPVLTPLDVADDRLHECHRRARVCYDPESGQCKMCSCYVTMKTVLATEKCPFGHWGRWFPWTRGTPKRKMKQ